MSKGGEIVSTAEAYIGCSDLDQIQVFNQSGASMMWEFKCSGKDY